MDRIQRVLNEVSAACTPLKIQGKVANYIEPLARVDRNFGIACESGGSSLTAGTTERFSIQSISKVLSLAFGLHKLGDPIWNVVGLNATGRPFNSSDLVTLRPKPMNACVNAGALAISSHLFMAVEFEEFLDFLTLICGESIGFDGEVAEAELRDCATNREIFAQLERHSAMPPSVNLERTLRLYCRQCAVTMSCAQVAKAFKFLSNRGKLGDGTLILTPSDNIKVLAMMTSAGTYDNAGSVLAGVQAPAKSGVGGGLVAVYPGNGTACAFSPGLDEFGNSFAAQAALAMFTSEMGWSILE